MTIATRHRQLPGPVGEAIRDLAGHADAQPRLQVVKLTALYAEPMTLKLDHTPDALMLARVQDDSAPEEPIDALAPVSFTAIEGGVRIDSAFGLGIGERYRFVFLVIG